LDGIGQDCMADLPGTAVEVAVCGMVVDAGCDIRFGKAHLLAGC